MANQRARLLPFEYYKVVKGAKMSHPHPIVSSSRIDPSFSFWGESMSTTSCADEDAFCGRRSSYSDDYNTRSFSPNRAPFRMGALNVRAPAQA